MTGIKNHIEDVMYRDSGLAQQYFDTGALIDMTVGQALKATTKQYPDRLAYISDERNISFAQLDAETDRLGAALLDLGLTSGDRVMFQMGTNVEVVVALVACYKVGVVPVCAVPQYREVEIGHLVRLSQAKGYIVQADFSASFDLVEFAQRMMGEHDSLQYLVVARGGSELPSAASRMDELVNSSPLEYARQRINEVDIGSEDVLNFQLSGGTTGVPKIIPRFHAEYLSHASGWMKQWGIDSDSRILWSLSLVHNAGQLYALIPVLLRGTTAVVMPKVDVQRMLELIEQHHVTHALSIGPIAPQLMAYSDVDRHDLSSLQLFSTMDRADSLEAHLGVPCANLYGTTEGLLLGASADAPRRARYDTQGASGNAADKIRLLEPESENPVAMGDVGELCIKGPSTLMSYYRAPEANKDIFTVDGFLRTGDLMTAQEIDGKTYYAFQGRMRDNINRGGEKIGCREVEDFICSHPAVADAKLVAMPDPIFGEKGCVYLIVRSGYAAPDIQELLQFLVGKGLAKFKCPERVEILDNFPVTRVGKVDKPALQAMISKKMQQENGH